jgi:hypothetical protein
MLAREPVAVAVNYFHLKCGRIHSLQCRILMFYSSRNINPKSHSHESATGASNSRRSVPNDQSSARKSAGYAMKIHLLAPQPFHAGSTTNRKSTKNGLSATATHSKLARPLRRTLRHRERARIRTLACNHQERTRRARTQGRRRAQHRQRACARVCE